MVLGVRQSWRRGGGVVCVSSNELELGFGAAACADLEAACAVVRCILLRAWKADECQ